MLPGCGPSRLLETGHYLSRRKRNSQDAKIQVKGRSSVQFISKAFVVVVLDSLQLASIKQTFGKKTRTTLIKLRANTRLALQVPGMRVGGQAP